MEVYTGTKSERQARLGRKVAVGLKTKLRFGLSPSGQTMFATHESMVEAKSRGRRRRGKAAKPWSKGKYRSVCNFRLAGMQRVIGGRHAGPVDTDDAETYYMAALPHLVARNWAYGRDEERIMSVKWAATWTPDLMAAKGREWFAEQEQRILAAFDNNDGRPSLPSADEFARELGITHAEVMLHDLRTIGAVDRVEAQRVAQEREADRTYQKERRVENGATPREDSTSALKPWKYHGISRATYYRRVAADQLDADPAMLKRIDKAVAKRPVLRLVS